MISLKNVSYKVDSFSEFIFKNISADFQSGLCYAILDSSKNEASYLVSILAKIDIQDQGDIFFDQKNISSFYQQEHIRKNVGLIFNEKNLFTNISALENVRLNLKVDKSPMTNQEILDLLLNVGIDQKTAKLPIRRLSNFKIIQVCIAKALSCDAPVILADDPTKFLNEKESIEIMQQLIDIAKSKNKCVIVTTNNNFIANLSDHKFIFINQQLLQIK